MEVLNTDGNIFIGGHVKPTMLTKGRFRHGFRGCIHKLVLQGRTIDFEKDVVSTGNLVPCTE